MVTIRPAGIYINLSNYDLTCGECKNLCGLKDGLCNSCIDVAVEKMEKDLEQLCYEREIQ